MQLLRSTPDRNRRQASHYQEKETEEQSPSSTKLGNQGQEGGKEHRQHRRSHRNLFKSLIELGVLPASKNQPGERDHREDQEDGERHSNIGGIEEPQYPHPLVDSGERNAQRRQQRPAFAIGDPAKTGVEDDEITEERQRLVESRRQHERSGKAADQSEQRNKKRVPPNRQDHRRRGHQRHRHKGRHHPHQLPQDVGREKRRKQHRDSSAVESVGGDRVAPGSLQLADHE